VFCSFAEKNCACLHKAVIHDDCDFLEDKAELKKIQLGSLEIKS